MQCESLTARSKSSSRESWQLTDPLGQIGKEVTPSFVRSMWDTRRATSNKPVQVKNTVKWAPIDLQVYLEAAVRARCRLIWVVLSHRSEQPLCWLLNSSGGQTHCNSIILLSFLPSVILMVQQSLLQSLRRQGNLCCSVKCILKSLTYMSGFITG